MNYSLEDPLIRDFVDAFDPVNEFADNFPGFVWRLQTIEGDATDFQIYKDDRYLVNMSVWRNAESLKAFVASAGHSAIMQRRAEWFDRMEQAYSVLWWAPEHHRPDVSEAEAKLDYLRANAVGVHIWKAVSCT